VESAKDIIGVKFTYQPRNEIDTVGEQFANFCGFKIDGAMTYKPTHL
jgi:hypothetical protein